MEKTEAEEEKEEEIMAKRIIIDEPSDVREFRIEGQGKVPVHDDIGPLKNYMLKFEEPIRGDRIIDALRCLRVSFEMSGLELKEE